MQQRLKIPLPIDPYLDQIVIKSKEYSTLLIKASPGSGKTTRLPWAIAKTSPQKVLVLEPRKLAAKLAAQRIAYEENLKIGEAVGYHFRFEKNYTVESKLVFFTEGTFLKLLLHDPELAGIGTVIIDEFHERHLETDTALAYLRALQQKRSELKIILMSATLDLKVLENYANSHAIEIHATQFHVALTYLPNQPSILNQTLEQKIIQTLRSLPSDSGDILIFLPGMREMLRTQEALGQQFGEVYLLHADLSPEEQAQALVPGPPRRIVLATNVAESSITIPGIRVVIDSGIARAASYSPWHGLKFIKDTPITQSSAIQRAGRAGRVADGLCFRLYSQQDFERRETFTIPEILHADLTDLCLLAAELPYALNWYTPPPLERWQKAGDLCRKLGAMDQAGRLSDIGRKMQQYPLGARLSRVLLAGEKLKTPAKKKLLQFICEVIERDQYGQLMRRLQSYLNRPGDEDLPWQQCLIPGFIDQVAKLRTAQRDLIHYSGKTLKLHSSVTDLTHDYYLVLDITQRQEAITLLAVQEEWFYQLEPFPFSEDYVVVVDEKIQSKRQTRLGSILLEEENLTLAWNKHDPALLDKLLLQGEKFFQEKLAAWKEQDTYLRLHFWSRFKSFDLDSVDIKLQAYFEFNQAFNWSTLELFFEQQYKTALQIDSLEILLPTRIKLAGNKELPVHYPYGLEPFVEAPIQDFFGLNKTPTINGGATPLTLKLLGPHKRPIQVTRDIEGFWLRTYQEMKKAWSRDYPRHHWPDDPARARPVLLKRQL